MKSRRAENSKLQGQQICATTWESSLRDCVCYMSSQVVLNITLVVTLLLDLLADNLSVDCTRRNFRDGVFESRVFKSTGGLQRHVQIGSFL